MTEPSKNIPLLKGEKPSLIRLTHSMTVYPSFTVVLMLFYVLESVFPNTFRLCLIVSEFKRDVYIFFV